MTAPTRRAVLAGAAGLAIGGSAFGQTGAALARCPAGRFVGERLPGGIGRFLGIRYGRAARFRSPVAEGVARDPVRTVAFGPVAPQRSRRGPQAEDCLFLNVWSPAVHPTARLPVMVYVHGGAFAFGGTADPVVDGARLAARGAVVVTVGHRLNAFGYLYLAGLDPLLADSGNAGQLDLVLALRWVRANIAAFGGDPGCITAFGDSGGGGKVTTLLAMPAATGLIHRAATMSGQQVTVSGPVNATRRARTLLAKLGLPTGDPAPLLDMPAERLLDGLEAEDPLLEGPLHMGPVLDMRNIVRHPFWPDAHPLSLGVPMLTGTTRDETRAFSDPDGAFVRSMAWDDLARRIAAELPVDLPGGWIVAEYSRHLPDATPADVYFRATTAGRSWRGQLEVAEARARAGRPAWLYRMDSPGRADPRRGAFHGIDLPMLFGTTDAAGAGTGDDAAIRALSREIQNRFLAFAAHGDPSRPGLPPWPAYTLPRRPTMILDATSRTVDDPDRWQRLLFARAPYVQPGS